MNESMLSIPNHPNSTCKNSPKSLQIKCYFSSMQLALNSHLTIMTLSTTTTIFKTAICRH
ncbi:hypothetical protein Hanom_Chr10g00885661 [Helianthus anomalus]